MKVLVIGTGYVGLVQGVCLAEIGHEITCIDVDAKKVQKLKKAVSPIYEPGIEDLIKKNVKGGRLSFDTSLKKHINVSDVVFIAVGTPSDEDGSADLKYVFAVAEEIGRHLKKEAIVVTKSTVPVGTNRKVKDVIASHYEGDLEVISNPEFLREGSAIEDFMHPDRIVIGFHENQKAAEKVAALYKPLKAPVLMTDLETAEMIKYASNSFLAVEISFINTIAQVCEHVGADVKKVAKGMKLDKRIGPKAFLAAGLGYGGSCFPKDVKALIRIAKDHKVDFRILKDTEAVNKEQRQRFVLKIQKTLGSLRGKRIAVLGVAFKPETDDIREAPAITVIEALTGLGAEVVVYDPVAQANVKKRMPGLHFAFNIATACKGAHAVAIMTEWREFKGANWQKIAKTMDQPLMFDGRNMFEKEEMQRAGMRYFSIGRK